MENFSKKGIVTSPTFYESEAVNLSSTSPSSYSYTPTTGSNSCVEGFIVDYSNYKAGDKIHARITVEWNGFDTSNTNGTFSMWFQGSTYNVTSNVWEWKGTNTLAIGFGTITSLVLSSTSGIKTLETTVTINSEYPNTRNKVHVGLRTDYSNGTGTIKISNLIVTPEKYYIPITPPPRKILYLSGLDKIKLQQGSFSNSKSISKGGDLE